MRRYHLINNDDEYFPYESVGEQVALIFWILYGVSGIFGLLLLIAI